MNKTLIAGGLAAMALTVAAGAAVAQQAQTERPARVLRADADRDGRISRSEFVDARLVRLTAVDANRDGSVSREEMQAAGQARRAERADARFARLDANSDGSISRAEFDAPREARGGRGRDRIRGHRGQHPDRAGMRGGYERGPIAIADARARTEQAFTRLDKDGDGFVTAEERASARLAMREQSRERMVERRVARTARQASPQAPASE